MDWININRTESETDNGWCGFNSGPVSQHESNGPQSAPVLRDSTCTLGNIAELWGNLDTHVDTSTDTHVDTSTDTHVDTSTDTHPDTSTDTHPEYKMVDGSLFNNKYYSGVLETKRHNTERWSGKNLDYLTIPIILGYVTCGGSVCDSYLTDLTKEVIDNLDNVKMVEEVHVTYYGKAYIREVLAVSWEQYIVVARVCLEWVCCNPEKVSSSK
jgi:hypothetical protein